MTVVTGLFLGGLLVLITDFWNSSREQAAIAQQVNYYCRYHGSTNLAAMVLRFSVNKIFRKKLMELKVTLKKKMLANLNPMLFPKKRDVVFEKMINNLTLVSHYHES